MSCTESLGFESSDERRVEVDRNDDINGNEGGVCSRKMRRSRMKFGEVKKFPPPLSSLNHNGRRSFFLRAVRKDGRLELTEVRLDRAETLCASREDGRLRLHLIQDCIEEEQEEENLELEQEEEEEKEDKEEEEKMVEGVEEDIEEERVEEWKFPVSGEGLRRCIEMASHDHHNQYHHHHHHHHHSNHHHNLNVWRQHCVTTG